MSDPIKIIAILSARPEQIAALTALLDEVVQASRSEVGNLRYDVWIDPAEPGRFVLDELYASERDLQAHRETAHFKAYLAKISNLAERTSMVLKAHAVA